MAIRDRSGRRGGRDAGSRQGAASRAATGGGLQLATEEAWLRGTEHESGPQRDFLTFIASDEEYAIDIQRIREIIKVRPVTEVPHAPAFIIGVIAVRGTVLPVIDLRARLRLAAAGLARSARFLIVGRGEERFGLLVDEVKQVVRLAESEIEPPPPMLASGEGDFVAGIGRPRGRMVILLELDQVLAFEVTARGQGKASEARRLQGVVYGEGRR